MDVAHAPHHGEIIAAFLERYADSNFWLKETLFAGLRSGEIALRSCPDEKQPSRLSSRHFLGIYEDRAEWMHQYPTDHAAALRYDTLAFCGELRKNPEATVEMWSFTLPPYYDFVLFTVGGEGHVLGCIKVVDARLTTNEDHRKLWGEERHHFFSHSPQHELPDAG